MKTAVKPLIISMGIAAILFSCQNELPVNPEDKKSINATARAVIPADAIALSETTTTFEFENNTAYYIPGDITIEALRFNSSSYEGVNLYVEGTWEIPNDNAEADYSLPTGLNITVVDGGQLLTQLEYLDILSETTVFIAVGGTFRTVAPTVVYLGYNLANSGGTFTNYGTVFIEDFDARNGYFYNLNPGSFSTYSFYEPVVASRYVNTGTLVIL